jgi:hypothetical protein
MAHTSGVPWTTVLIVIMLPAFVHGATGKVDCRSLGFTETLVCSKCTRLQILFSILTESNAICNTSLFFIRLEELVRDEVLAKECRQCCSEDVDETNKAKVF